VKYCPFSRSDRHEVTAMLAISPSFGNPSVYDMMDVHIGDEITITMPTRWLEAWLVAIKHHAPAAIRLVESDGVLAYQVSLYPLVRMHTWKGITKTEGTPPLLFMVENLPVFVEGLEHMVYAARNYGGGYRADIKPECTELMKTTVALQFQLLEGCPRAWCNPWSCPAFYHKMPVAFYRN